jgi:5-methylcytosine-specific restriction endonuclease McrA
MNEYSLSHLSDKVLLSNLSALVVQGREQTAVLLAHIAEVEARRLDVPAGYPSMYEYCVRKLHFSEDGALKRIRVARKARLHPGLFASIAAGRISLSAALLLAPNLTGANAAELLEAATHKTCKQIYLLLAERFPQGPVAIRVEPIFASPVGSAAPVGALELDGPASANAPTTSEHALSVGTNPVAPEVPRPRVRPLSPENYALQCTIRRETHEKLERIQAMLRHNLPSGDLSEVIDQAFAALLEKLEKAKFAATSRPQTRKTSSVAERAGTSGETRRAAKPQTRYIPAEVKRAVWKRDGGQCTFVGPSGRRCPARSFLEFDHIEAFARGGKATVEGMRLLCRAHNQYTAEQAFGAGFMRQKRQRTASASTEQSLPAAARPMQGESISDDAFT